MGFADETATQTHVKNVGLSMINFNQKVMLSDNFRPPNRKYDKLYMDIAIRLSEESKCPRKRVGCVILTESGLLAPGFNGHACGGPNEWEYTENGNPEVVHAELNATGKMLEEGVSLKGATAYTTLCPCLDCAKLFVRAKLKRVVFLEDYRKTDGLDYLMKYSILTEKYNENKD